MDLGQNFVYLDLCLEHLFYLGFVDSGCCFILGFMYYWFGHWNFFILGFLVIGLYYGIVSEDEKRLKGTICWLGAVGAVGGKAWAWAESWWTWFGDKRIILQPKKRKWGNDSLGSLGKLSLYFFFLLGLRCFGIFGSCGKLLDFGIILYKGISIIIVSFFIVILFLIYFCKYWIYFACHFDIYRCMYMIHFISYPCKYFKFLLVWLLLCIQ